VARLEADVSEHGGTDLSMLQTTEEVLGWLIAAGL
jgi:hypothetical protein